MIKGDQFELFGHTMEVQLKKESLDTSDGTPRELIRYDLMCICHTYPRNLIMEITEDDLNLVLLYDYFPDSINTIMEGRNE